MSSTTGHDIIVIGASAGGMEAVSTLVAQLPATLPAAVFVVVHTSPRSPGYLGDILHQAGQLPARLAVDGEPIRAGTIRVREERGLTSIFLTDTIGSS